MNRLMDLFEKKKTCEYKGNIYSLRDNDAIPRHSQ